MSYETPTKEEHLPTDECELCISSESFEHQLEDKHHVQVLESEHGHPHFLEYVDIRPDTIPERERGTPVVMFVGGFNTVPEDYRQMLLTFVQHGRRVVYCNPTRGMTPPEDLAVYAREHGVAPLIAAKAAEVAYLKDHLRLRHMALVGHSQGGAVACLAAAHLTDDVDLLILDTPAGLVGTVSTPEFVRRAADEAGAEAAYYATHPETISPTRTTPWRAAQIFVRESPDVRAREVDAIGHTDLIPLLRTMDRMRDHTGTGPDMYVVTAENDRIFTRKAVGANMQDLENTSVHWVTYADKSTHHSTDSHPPELLWSIMSEHAREAARRATSPTYGEPATRAPEPSHEPRRSVFP